MFRVTTWEHNPAIQVALRLVPPPILHRVPPRFFTGDPIRAGLHSYENTDDGRSYRTVCHVVYAHHQTHRPVAERRSVIVLARPPDSPDIAPDVIVHEFGHLLHETVGFWPHAEPVTVYAQSNPREAFAEAFTAWADPTYLLTTGDALCEATDARTRALFDGLALGV